MLDPDATYRIVTNSFLADGGDSFTVFTEGTNRIGGGDDLAAFTDYLGANSPVSRPRTGSPASEVCSLHRRGGSDTCAQLVDAVRLRPTSCAQSGSGPG